MVTQVRPARLAIQVPVSEAEGLKHANAVHCDDPVMALSTRFGPFVMVCFGPQRPAALHVALKAAVSLLE